MPDLTRFWLVTAGPREAAPGHVPGVPSEVGDLLGSIPASAVVSSPHPADRAAAQALARRLDVPVAIDPALSPRRAAQALDRLAGAHPGRQLVLLASPRFLAAALRAALALESPAPFHAPGPRSVTLDWPVHEDRTPALVGVDLDWSPPFSPEAPRRFPGGPPAVPPPASG